MAVSIPTAEALHELMPHRSFCAGDMVIFQGDECMVLEDPAFDDAEQVHIMNTLTGECQWAIGRDCKLMPAQAELMALIRKKADYLRVSPHGDKWRCIAYHKGNTVHCDSYFMEEATAGVLVGVNQLEAITKAEADITPNRILMSLCWLFMKLAGVRWLFAIAVVGFIWSIAAILFNR